MSYEKITNCPSCNSDSFQNHIIAVDQLVSKESFVITKCNSCGLLFTNPRPDKESIGAYYESEEYVSHSSSKSSLKNILYKTARFYSIRKKERLIRKFNGISTLLDFGCGTGEFLKHCQKRGWAIQGIEPNSKARSVAEKSTNTNVLSDLDKLSESTYDVITLWHVLEHVHELKETLNLLSHSLSKTGRLIIAVPNHNSYDAELYSDQWAGWDVPRHLYHFNQKSMDKLIRNNQLKIETILPMKLDSFYVSLLSEQYTGNNPGYFKALKTGLQSNKKAKINTNYSSLIYIIRHK